MENTPTETIETDDPPAQNILGDGVVRVRAARDRKSVV